MPSLIKKRKSRECGLLFGAGLLRPPLSGFRGECRRRTGACSTKGDPRPPHPPLARQVFALFAFFLLEKPKRAYFRAPGFTRRGNPSLRKFKAKLSAKNLYLHLHCTARAEKSSTKPRQTRPLAPDEQKVSSYTGSKQPPVRYKGFFPEWELPLKGTTHLINWL